MSSAASMRTRARLGFVTAIGPLAVPVLDRIHRASPELFGFAISQWIGGLAIGIAVAIVLGGLLARLTPRWGIGMQVIGLVGFAVAAAAGAAESPLVVMAYGLGALLVAVLVVTAVTDRDDAGEWVLAPSNHAARGAAWGAFAAILLSLAFGLFHGLRDQIACVAPAAISLGYGIVALLRGASAGRREAMAWIVIVAGITVWWSWGEPALSLLSSLWFPVGLLIALPPNRDARAGEGFWDGAIGQPTRFLVLSFVLAGLVGAILLSLPVASTAAPISLIDAIFTSFSAVCVTGLTVVDTPTTFTPFGEAAILLLIQVGGLGIMTFSTAGFFLLGRRMSVKQEAAAVALLGSESRASLVHALRRMLVVTAVVEAIGAVCLTWSFHSIGDSWPSAIWRGVFHAISAYCNAGFGLQSTNIVPYAEQPFIVIVLSLLIVAGSLGPAVIVALPALVRGRRVPLGVVLGVKVTLWLLIVPTILILMIEWDGVLAAFGPFDKLTNAWFQAVVPRTAGFNSVDYPSMRPATITITIVLMFIGGTPGSTAGGVKTTTTAVLFLAVAGALRHRDELRTARRVVPNRVLLIATATVVLYTALCLVGILILQLTQQISSRDLVFEVVSAIATVGLSTGATVQLDEVGKLIVTILMLAGRVGPLALVGVGFTHQVQPPWRLPEEEVPVG